MGFERRNSPYFTLFHWIRYVIRGRLHHRGWR